VAVEVLMPKLGMTMEQGKLVEWAKKEKDAVRKGDIICIIETDKVTFEVESPGSGLLLILMEPAENILVGVLMGYIAENEAEYFALKKLGGPTSAVQKQNESAGSPLSAPCWLDSSAPTDQTGPEGNRRASPAARVLSRKLGVLLADCVGTGPNGRITKRDVEMVMIDKPPAQQSVTTHKKSTIVEASPGARKQAKEKGLDLAAIHGTGPNGKIMRRDVIHALKSDLSGVPSTMKTVLPPDFKGKRLFKEEPMSSIRHTISCRMMESLECSAQMTAFSEWDVSSLMRLRKFLNNKMEQNSVKITFPGLMVFLLARVLQEMPVFNTSVEGKNIKYWHDVNIGVAVSVGENLVVPVVHGAERKSLMETQLALTELIEKARNKKLMPDDMQGGTFTLSNLGSYGSQWETVILNPPEVALLGIGAIEKKPVVVEDEIVVRKMMPISLTFDHRIIDGATAGAFRNRMKRLVEAPETIISYFPDSSSY
jgi:pyruvate dehydrogenase E2 component (dihydrolipoamide acetyltransferase)